MFSVTRAKETDIKWIVKFWGIGFLFMLVLAFVFLVLFFGFVASIFGG